MTAETDTATDEVEWKKFAPAATSSWVTEDLQDTEHQIGDRVRVKPKRGGVALLLEDETLGTVVGWDYGRYAVVLDELAEEGFDHALVLRPKTVTAGHHATLHVEGGTHLDGRTWNVILWSRED